MSQQGPVRICPLSTPAPGSSCTPELPQGAAPSSRTPTSPGCGLPTGQNKTHSLPNFVPRLSAHSPGPTWSPKVLISPYSATSTSLQEAPQVEQLHSEKMTPPSHQSSGPLALLPHTPVPSSGLTANSNQRQTPTACRQPPSWPQAQGQQQGQPLCLQGPSASWIDQGCINRAGRWVVLRS